MPTKPNTPKAEAKPVKKTVKKPARKPAAAASATASKPTPSQTSTTASAPASTPKAAPTMTAAPAAKPAEKPTEKSKLLLALVAGSWVGLAALGFVNFTNKNEARAIDAQLRNEITQLTLQSDMLTNKVIMAENRLTQMSEEMTTIVKTYLPAQGLKKDEKTSTLGDDAGDISALSNPTKRKADIASVATTRKFEKMGFEAETVTASLPNDQTSALEDQILQASETSDDVKEARRSNNMLVSAVKLRDAVYNAQRFTGELDSFKRYAGQDQAVSDSIATLEKYAEKGITPIEDLQREFDKVADDITNLSRKNKPDQNILDKAALQLAGLVKVRKIDTQEKGDNPEDILARANQSLAAGAISSAAEELKKLPEEARALAESWIAKATAVTASKTATDDIFSHVTTVVQAKKQG